MKKSIKFSIDPQGWVKLQRSLLDSPIMKNPKLLQIYIWSLLKANHKAKWFSIQIGKGSKEIYCDIGQFITGRKRAAEELGMPGSTWRSNIKKLQGYGYLTIKADKQYSFVTVINYGAAAPDAQINGQQKKKQKNNKVTSKEQPTNTNNNVNNEKKEKKENNKNNKFNYSSFSLSNSFKSLNEKMQNEYLKIAKLLESKYEYLTATCKPLNPTHYKLLCKAYPYKDILSTLESLNNDPL